MKLINIKKMKLLTNKQQTSYQKSKSYYICKEKIENKYVTDKKYRKVRDHSHYAGKYRDAAHSICNLKYCIPKQISYCFS